MLSEKKDFQTPVKNQTVDYQLFLYMIWVSLVHDGDDVAVVWNPWEKKSKTMTDFGDDEYKSMLCVDGAALERPITLKPGEEWTGKLMLTAVKSSFCFDQLELQSKGF